MEKILYISNTSRVERPYLDPSVRYRCFNPAEEVMKYGHIADVVSYEKFEVEMVDFYNIFIFHRPPYDNKLFTALEQVKKKGKKYFADYDDLIFNKKHALISPLYKQGRVDEQKCIDIFTRNEKALGLFENVLVSTEYLKQKVLLSCPNAKVSVVHNALSSSVIKRIALKGHKKSISNQKVISYMSGTASHNHDFEIIEDTLVDLLNKYHSKAQLIVVGPLEFNKNKFKHVIHKRYVEYEKLFDFISQTHINLAPLELNDFTNCKSGLKFFESGILGIPSVVSPIDDMLRFKDSKGISYANSSDEWYEKIEKLIVDDTFYHESSKKTQEYVQTKCTIEHTIKEYAETIGVLL